MHYQWTPSSAVDNDTIENPYFTGNSTVHLDVSVTDSNGITLTDTVHVTVHTSPLINSWQTYDACISCSNGRIELTSVSASSNYVFTITPNPGATIVEDTISNLPAGIYTVCIRDINCKTCITDTIFESNVSISKINPADFILYPNPLTNSAELIIPDNYEKLNLEWSDRTGKIVRIDNLKRGKNIISKNSLSEGIYFLTLKSNDKVEGRIKLIITK